MPGQNSVPMVFREEDQYFDINFESWTSAIMEADSVIGGHVLNHLRVLMYIVWGLMKWMETGDGLWENPFATIGHAVNIMEK